MLTSEIQTTGSAARISASADRTSIKADGADVAVVTISLTDRKGRFVPDACEDIRISVDGPVHILGVGNGDPAWQTPERPSDPDARTFSVKTFNGLAQVLLQSSGAKGPATLTLEADGIAPFTLDIETK